MRKYIIIIAGLLLLALTACDEVEVNPEVEDEKEEEEKINTVIGENKITIYDEEVEFDELQKLYIDINNGLTYEELINRLDESDLIYNSGNEEKGYRVPEDVKDRFKIAYNEIAADFKSRTGFAADKGTHQKDFLLVEYSLENKFNYVEYLKKDKNPDIYITLLNYKRGYYGKFSHVPEYAGYYIKDRKNNVENFKIQYEDYEQDTGFLKANSIEDQMTYFFINTNQELNRIYHNN